jgi:pyrimidine-nucleoside phosphorylase
VIPQWIIEKKRDGQTLAGDEIRSLIDGYTRGDIPDYQMSAFAMAVYFRGMNEDETAILTDAMMRSGEILDLSAIPLPKVDKHSTGGVGDKISLPLAPLLAACGVAVPMISGRGLGITGGTLDKLESIPGFNVRLPEEQFLAVLRDVGCAMSGQTARLAPADRKLYALRDVTATVPSVPLIVSSILSKKLAEGVDHLVLDVKCGRGAFMKTPEAAHDLAGALVRTARAMGKSVRALVTDMNQPLGRAAGNALEIIESVEVLLGRGPADVELLTLTLGAELLQMAGVSASPAEAVDRLREAIRSGAAMARFRALVRAQGGDAEALDDYNRLPAASIQAPLSAPTTGWIGGVDAERVGRACVVLGAGRVRTEDRIDPAVGVSGLAKVGERVEKGRILAVVHANDESRLAEAKRLLSGAFIFSDRPVDPPALILERIA